MDRSWETSVAGLLKNYNSSEAGDHDDIISHEVYRFHHLKSIIFICDRISFIHCIFELSIEYLWKGKKNSIIFYAIRLSCFHGFILKLPIELFKVKCNEFFLSIALGIICPVCEMIPFNRHSNRNVMRKKNVFFSLLCCKYSFGRTQCKHYNWTASPSIMFSALFVAFNSV